MTNILVTGGAGYIGSHAVKKLLEEGNSVTVIDNFTHGYRQAIKSLYEFGEFDVIEGDIRNKDDLDKAFSGKDINAVMHFAAALSVAESMKVPEKYFDNNVYGSLNLLKKMKENNVSNIILSSTCTVYGDTNYLPVDEKHPLNPESPYGESKLMMENIAKWFDKIHDIKFVALRYFNVAGASEEGVIGCSKKEYEPLIPKAVKGALNISPFELTCAKVRTRDGTPVRDYINISDLIDAHVKAMEYLLSGGKSEIINLGTGTGYTVLEIVNEVEKVSGVDIPRKEGKQRQGEIEEIYASNEKAKRILNWEPKHTLKETIESSINWYKNYPHGFEY